MKEPSSSSSPLATASDAKTVTARCYCGSVRYTLTFPASSSSSSSMLLPLTAYICHCSTCRYSHGTLGAFHSELPVEVQPQFIAPSSLEGGSSMTAYWMRSAVLYFCSTCGCHVGARGNDSGKWFPSVSLFPKDESVFVLREHWHTNSGPNGLADWLPSLGEDRPLALRALESRPSIPVAEKGKDGEDRLRCECHCGGVSFTFPRPTRKVLDDPFMSEVVSPLGPRKYKAVVDACNDCRRHTGDPVTAWTFVPLALMEPRIGRDLAVGTSRVHASSPGTLRSFCGVCGATVFFWHDSRRTNDEDAIVDVAVGLLRAPEGVRADDWLDWRTSRLANAEAGAEYDAEFYESLRRGMGEWGMRHYGQDLAFDLF
ncbi:Mss4-like protein [Xylariomycetidae sp. FL2044]|nr:Mss4-like protein [Xylariomycetidae sp. FL2044]